MTNELGIYTSENNRLVVSSRKVAEVFEKLHNGKKDLLIKGLLF